MSENDFSNTQVLPMAEDVDTGTALAHRLIASQASDYSQPYMLHGHPCAAPLHGEVVRACFYYAVTVGPKVTVLYDNWDKGGMCELVSSELHAIWRTDDLLTAMGTTYDALRNGTAVLNSAPVPRPHTDLDDLNRIFRPGKFRDSVDNVAPDFGLPYP